MPALGRIIYFSNSGREEARERPASTSQAAGAQRRGRDARALRLRVAAGLWAWDVPAGSSDAGGVTQVAAGRGEAEAQRYRREAAVGS